ncbi:MULTISPECIES: tripartite tricarboxylate transporter substrate binding protein [Ramlibacter]|uniref:Tripartite tricarboxylate transporter substrate binding protein n=1 Tax=Ramlibacter aquaticus TaxID=2780094 RepID=A0ABR9SJ04_9BURK|nr:MULTISPECIES: tripartite tricarboxylate transporter substrate binding protein [Ramlibacter]MBE7942330.1 tripartite tricarboxylate transporter substrate binding protein [Ramlibacter aquaticus]
MRVLLFAALLLAASPGAWAQPQPWPTRNVRLVVAYHSGGVSDVVARALADRLSPALGVPVVVENKAGASGTIGMEAVARAAPDGGTFGFSAVSPLTLNPYFGQVAFDPRKAIAPVASVMVSPVLLLGTPALAATDFRGLLALAREKPGAVRWATSGPASLGHLMLEQLKSAAKLDITHVPYKGGGQQLTDAIGGQFEVLSVNAGPTVQQQVQAGKLHALAVGAPARLASLPGVPTLAELGWTAANLSSQFGVFAPAATPPALIERLNAEVNKALADPGLRATLLAAGNLPTGGSAAAFARSIAEESEANARIIRAAGLRAE